MALNVALVPGPDQVIVRLTGDVDLSTVPVVDDALRHAATIGTSQVVVDLGASHFWDCSGLHALASFTRELAAAGRSCRIVGALPDTRRLIGVAYLSDRLVLDGALPAAPLPRPRPGAPVRRRGSGRPVPVRAEPSPVGAGRPARGV